MRGACLISHPHGERDQGAGQRPERAIGLAGGLGPLAVEQGATVRRPALASAPQSAGEAPPRRAGKQPAWKGSIFAGEVLSMNVDLG
ncbi:MAG: hypothetical protein M5U01_11605 [Ardenticatenaceae bacterium]|nr:hypothetical protein [Ardenticatenaceae bacterium]